jgi:hypothetical protein
LGHLPNADAQLEVDDGAFMDAPVIFLLSNLALPNLNGAMILKISTIYCLKTLCEIKCHLDNKLF